jgi:hypothetical protein
MSGRQSWLRAVYTVLLVAAGVLFVVMTRLHEGKTLAYALLACLGILTVVMALALVDLRWVAQARLEKQRELERTLHETLTQVAAKRREVRAGENASKGDPGNGRS